MLILAGGRRNAGVEKVRMRRELRAFLGRTERCDRKLRVFVAVYAEDALPRGACRR